MSQAWERRFAERAHRVRGSAVRELLKITEQPDFISFGGGLPSPDVFPVDEISEAMSHVMREQASRALQYSTTEGYRPLRRWIADAMSRDGLRLDENNVLITAGSQQALDLLGKLLVDSDDRIVVESPTYLAMLQVWRAYGARFVETPSDDDGMVSATLPSILSTAPKLIYCVPNFQNPRGVTLSGTRRKELISLACRFDVAVVEDDPYGALRFEGDRLPSLMALDGAARSSGRPYDGNVITLGSFSKVLAPGLRVGWVAAAPSVIEKLTLVKQGTDLHTATFNQMVVHHLADSGAMDRHLRVIIDAYRARRDLMLDAMQASFPTGIHWTRPLGGMFLWVTLPENVDAADVLQEAIRRKVAFVAGAPFHASGAGKNTMRLNFSNASEVQIREGIARIGELLHAIMASRPQAAA